MPRVKPEVKRDAQTWFVRRGMSYEQIAATLGVAKTTVAKWGKAGEWTRLRREYQQSAPSAPLDALKKQRALLIEGMGVDQVADPSQINSLAQVDKVIERMERSREDLGATLDLIESMAAWARERVEREKWTITAEVLEEYLNHLREQANG